MENSILCYSIVLSDSKRIKCVSSGKAALNLSSWHSGCKNDFSNISKNVLFWKIPFPECAKDRNVTKHKHKDNLGIYITETKGLQGTRLIIKCVGPCPRPSCPQGVQIIMFLQLHRVHMWNGEQPCQSVPLAMSALFPPHWTWWNQIDVPNILQGVKDVVQHCTGGDDCRDKGAGLQGPPKPWRAAI